MKKTIDFLACPETYKKLQLFSTCEELDASIYNHLKDENNRLTKTMIEVLKLIGRYSLKYMGVSFLSKNKIGKLTGKSRRTIIRVCHQLEEFGIIRQYALKRKSDNQQTSNAIVILPHQQKRNVTQEKMQNVTPLNHPSLSIKKELNTYPEIQPLSPFLQFQHMCQCFTKDQKLINRMYGIYTAQIVHLNGIYIEKTLLKIGIESVKIVFQAVKRKKLRSISGYFNGVLNQLLDRLYYEDMEEKHWKYKER
ncbi:helix-turn-helix domain-containing protein [Bacillus sp. V2I10]|uniref:helix-turn-helix domain-containing protein n=1 Tax=Bacillus sp. V2I10 TaxID=3042276 RepID=UPI002784D035|nr:helix-turn-helix domain-containing protein [Bacillus sp. V2I10]MDQ0861070.1 hypothetical protein [Bacillus sp. V2I10]